MTMYINKWQRLVLSLGSIVCFVRAFYIWQDDYSDSRPGTAFLAGVTLAVLALIRAREGEAALPFLDIPAVRKWQIIRGVAVVAGLAIIGVAFVALSPETTYDASVGIADAAADNVEMPAEEAIPADSSTARPLSYLEQAMREDKERQDAVIDPRAYLDEREQAYRRARARPVADPVADTLTRMKAERARRDSYEGLSALERAADAAEAAADEAEAEASAMTAPNTTQP